MRDDGPPRHPLFDRIHEQFEPAGPDGIATPGEQTRMPEVDRRFAELLVCEKAKPRADRFLPYLVIRAVVNDRGTRPLDVPFWESPDIWIAPGDPASTPAVPASPGGTVQAGQPTTVYAHVWNLGLAPIAGAVIDFYWFDPTFGFTTANANLIGTARVDLPSRSSLQCHALVKCPAAWIPAFVNGGHECLIARASAFGDPIGPNEWDAWANRHVAQRNMTVTRVAGNVTPLATALEKSRRRGMRLQLLQIGSEEGALPVELLAPRLRVDAALRTQILAELHDDGRLTIPTVRAGVGGLRADANAALVPHEQVLPFESPRIAPSELVSLEVPLHALRRPRAEDDGRTTVAENATLFDLLRYDAFLSPRVRARLGGTIPPPAGADACVLRLVAYEGERLVGGYTLVVGDDTLPEELRASASR